MDHHAVETADPAATDRHSTHLKGFIPGDPKPPPSAITLGDPKPPFIHEISGSHCGKDVLSGMKMEAVRSSETSVPTCSPHGVTTRKPTWWSTTHSSPTYLNHYTRWPKTPIYLTILCIPGVNKTPDLFIHYHCSRLDQIFKFFVPLYQIFPNLRFVCITLLSWNHHNLFVSLYQVSPNL
jgi:hypothetical protein